MLPTIFEKPRKPRKDILYSKDEVKVLSKYKAEYREQTTREMRMKIFRDNILPDIFNYWITQETAPTEEEESNTRVKVGLYYYKYDQVDERFVQELLAWIRNNWRPSSGTEEAYSNLKVNPINVIWEIEKEAVEEELKEILGVEVLDKRDPGYFQQRNAAAKRLLGKMTERDRAQFEATLQDRRSKGHPEPVRRE
jgi:hypothetical protein